MYPILFVPPASSNYRPIIQRFGVLFNTRQDKATVYFVEMYSALTSADLADGVHPNATGYNKMADVWYNAIKADLSR
jgi:lysophospholipase L1-like esterase